LVSPPPSALRHRRGAKPDATRDVGSGSRRSAAVARGLLRAALARRARGAGLGPEPGHARRACLRASMPRRRRRGARRDPDRRQPSPRGDARPALRRSRLRSRRARLPRRRRRPPRLRAPRHGATMTSTARRRAWLLVMATAVLCRLGWFAVKAGMYFPDEIFQYL